MEDPLLKQRPDAGPHRCRAEIDLDALRHNVGVARSVGGDGVDLMAVVKADGYGHGLERVAACLDGERLAFFGVAGAIEARRLEDAGIRTRIHLLGPATPDERREIAARGWTPGLSSLEEASSYNEHARACGTTLAVHLAVDTGMGRAGFLPDELKRGLPELDRLSNLEIEGVSTHPPSADDDPGFTAKQFERFEKLVEELGGPGRFRFIHLSNSAGLLGFEQGICNLARPGLMLYGVSPLPSFQDRLRPVLTLESEVTLVRDLPAGHGIGYGRTFITVKPSTRVATIAIGYGDGYPRHLSNRNADVLIRGVRCPLLGRVTMDQIMADVSHLPEKNAPQPGDAVVLIGRQSGGDTGSDWIGASELAAKAGTIPWEILTGITARVTRVAAPPPNPDSTGS